MRVSTNMIYDLGTASMQKTQQELLRLQQQVSTGRRMLTPSDDPVAAAAVLDLRQSQAVNDQFRLNGDAAESQLGLEENALADITTLLQNVKTLAVFAGNPTLSNEDRDSLATEVEGNYLQMLAIANHDDGNGQFLFAGFQGATRPFAQTSPGNVTYNGDAGQRLVQIDSGRTVAVNDTGEAVFRAIRNGNGTFVTAAAVGNTGTGLIDTGTVTDPSLWNVAANSGSFSIRFDVAGGVTTFDIVDTVNNVSMLTGAAPAPGPHLRTYVAGGTVNLSTQSPPDTNPTAFDFGATVVIEGAPADGDVFSIAKSTNQDIFTTLQDLITNLRNGTTSAPASSAAYSNVLSSTMSNVDNALDNVLSVRTGVGERLKAIDGARNSSESLSLQYSQTLSSLEDLDFAKAISDLSLQQTYLQAAQQSFLRLTSLDLFKLL